ncbi:transmembrane protein, putative [Medicago truncatula]|uniref:Transmembrane protein, putative n=1 Tax=Medicago truncatula TaxID=3880 RepID=G7IIA5_MEDTR|nr:transmembrane protein, putative [Medicago truncatula]
MGLLKIAETRGKRLGICNIYLDTKITNQSGAAEAWWAHNPQVPGSKPGSDKFFLFLSTIFLIYFGSVTGILLHNQLRF